MSETDMPQTVTIVCAECGHIGICVVPIMVRNLWCIECGHCTVAPVDFWKPDASFDEIVKYGAIQERLVAERLAGAA